MKHIKIFFIFFAFLCLSCSNTRASNRDNIKLIEFTVASYNVGHYSYGEFSYPTMAEENYNDFYEGIKSLNTDILCLNEADEYFDFNKKIKAISLYNDYNYSTIGPKNNFDCNSIFSKYCIKNSGYTMFSNTESRYFSYSCVMIGEIEIWIISTQLEWFDISVRRTQIEELLDFVADKDYFILCGDFNTSNKVCGIQTYEIQYEEDYSLFEKSGYNVGNYKSSGWKNTLVKYGEGVFPWDNIITSNNIIIDSFIVSQLTFSDHYPIIADLSIII